VPAQKPRRTASVDLNRAIVDSKTAGSLLSCRCPICSAARETGLPPWCRRVAPTPGEVGQGKRRRVGLGWPHRLRTLNLTSATPHCHYQSLQGAHADSEGGRRNKDCAESLACGVKCG
jgi:hypothetical protein